ncbi:PilX N-terminal domain-containing pilus assembly protein [Granulosicoccus sp.]|nr:PilX N-terminal domain-containing pilus assembly protein [Granulosicoccus sp.]MDB4222254.1 PilX N-terminal domain-containing pilus assembly protein [Granulosicoccus sp.]
MKYIHSQRGGALLVAMVMIFMLSIMGVSVMRGSTLEHRMAVNAIRTAATFQAAESASNFAINSHVYMTEAHKKGLNGRHIVSTDSVNPSVTSLASNSSLSYTGKTIVEGFSAGEFGGLLFVATGVSSMENSGTQSTIEQGAMRIVPGDDG